MLNQTFERWTVPIRGSAVDKLSSHQGRSHIYFHTVKHYLLVTSPYNLLVCLLEVK